MGLGRAGTCSRTVNWWRGGRALLRLRLPGLHVGLWDQLRLLYGLRLRPDLSQWLWDCLRLLALLALNIVIVVVMIVFGRLRCSNQYCPVKMYRETLVVDQSHTGSVVAAYLINRTVPTRDCGERAKRRSRHEVRR